MMQSIIAPAQPSGVSILVVDDDPDMREGLCDALIDEGYRVSAANNGAEAVHKLSGKVPPDLIVMDLRMPVMDGYEFLERRGGDDSLSKIPVIVISASVSREISHDGVQILRKPVDLDALLGLIRRHLSWMPAAAPAS